MNQLSTARCTPSLKLPESRTLGMALIEMFLRVWSLSLSLTTMPNKGKKKGKKRKHSAAPAPAPPAGEPLEQLQPGTRVAARDDIRRAGVVCPSPRPLSLPVSPSCTLSKADLTIVRAAGIQTKPAQLRWSTSRHMPSFWTPRKRSCAR